MIDRSYPSSTRPPDPRSSSSQPAFDVVSMWENGEVRTVQNDGSSANHQPPFPNVQGCDDGMTDS